MTPPPPTPPAPPPDASPPTSPSAGSFTLTPDTPRSALLARYPHTRGVLERHGLLGTEEVAGEADPALGALARARGLDPALLMDELRRAIVTSARHPAGRAAGAPAAGWAQAIYRPYFLGGIAVGLTAGAGWGAWLLWRIGVAGDFTGVSIHQINAHGHAQIFGWVGLFIMGFALQALPRLWGVALPTPRLALASFGAMVVGIATRTLAMAAGGGAWWPMMAAGAGVLELLAIVAVAGILLTAFMRSNAPLEPYMAFVLAALGWFVLQAVAGIWHVWMLMTVAHRGELVWHVSVYQAPLRHLQLHGLALFMIVGVSLRMLPAMFGVPRVADRRAWWAFALLVIAVVGEVVLFVAYRQSGGHALAGALFLSWVLLAVGAGLVVTAWRPWRPMPTRDRSAKFVRAAYGWLAVSLVLLLLLPVYQWLSGIHFSHAYYGAVRHAFTVGFISMMIMGFAAKVVPTLTGRDPAALPTLWPTFILLNAGCALRVSMQTLSDWHPAFFAMVGISGVLELAALALWAGHLVRLMLVKPAEARPPAMQAGGSRGACG